MNYMYTRAVSKLAALFCSVLFWMN